MPLIKKPPEQIEAIVIGCGPAGIAAANALVDKGVEVLIVDAREKIGHPLRCGELTRPEYFDYFGIEPKKGWVRNKELHIRPYLSESEYINAPYISISKIIVDRQKSEFEASRILSEKGAYVLENASVNGIAEWENDHRIVSINSRGEIFKSSAHIIFAADGPSSTIVRYIRPEEFLSPGQVISYYGYQISSTEKLNPLKMGVFKFPQLSPFYFWIFPNSEHSANVGLGMTGYRGHLGKSYLDNCIKQFHSLSNCRIDQKVIGWTPSTAPIAKPYDDGLLMVGGAAWLTSAIYGEGLWQAVFSGKAAADYYMMNKSQPPTAINLSGYVNSLKLIYEELNKEYSSKLQTEEFAGGSL